MEALYGLVLISLLVSAASLVAFLRLRAKQLESSPSLPKAYADQILALEQRRLAIEEKRVTSEAERAHAGSELEAQKLALEARKIALAEGQAVLQRERHELELEMARGRVEQPRRGRHIPASELQRA